MHGLPIVDLGDEEEEIRRICSGENPAPGKKGSAKGKVSGRFKRQKRPPKDSKKKSDGVFHARAIGKSIAGGELPDEVLSDFRECGGGDWAK